jgi:hypothetical protein
MTTNAPPRSGPQGHREDREMTDTAHRTGSGGLPPASVHNAYNPVAGTTDDHPDGFPAGSPVVQSSSAGQVVPGIADSANTASVVGVASIPGVAGEHVLTQFCGPLTLTTAQWDQVTGGSGGLTPRARYYLSAGTEGRITTTAPSSGGTFRTQVGVALSTTDLMVQIGATTAN